jgi:putative transposase
MPRPLRPIDGNLIYHVINRGNNRAPVFLDDDDHVAFLKALGEMKERRPFEMYGYCLMANHFHLLIRPLETSISRLMQSLLVSHTHRFHRRHQGSGHVWEGRFKSPVVQEEQLLTVLRFVEANPVRNRIVDEAGDYRWSSFRAHGLGEEDGLLDPVSGYEALAKRAATRQSRWSAFVHKTPRDKELHALRRSMETGLPFGDAAWVTRLSKRLGLDLTIRPRGRPRKSEA